MNRSVYKLLSLFFCFYMGTILDPAFAQITKKVYQSDSHLDPKNNKKLSFELDNLNFFKNNEYKGTVQKGYSLPGLWIQPKLTYYPLKNIKLEAGLHVLLFHGTVRYPSFAYQDIAYWKGDQYQQGAHIVPFFRVQAEINKNFSLIIGNIYGASNHNLIDPLYSRELNMTADPETGLQLLFNTSPFTADIWLNWESFIFKNDTHQEAFTVGLSSSFQLNETSSPFHFYIPLQTVIQHRGGEIDTITTHSISTFMNGSLGFGVQWNRKNHIIKQMNLETHALGYYQQAGKLWPIDNGVGWYSSLTANIYDFRLKSAFWWNKDFVSMLGSSFYGALSTIKTGGVYNNPRMLFFGAEYVKTFGKGFSLGVDMDIYHMLSDKITLPGEMPTPIKSETNISFGISFRVNPSFLIKEF